MVSVLVTKCIVLVVLLLVTFFFSMLPVKFMQAALKQNDANRQRRFESAISLASVFSAGVFLATCLLDLFPAVQEKVNNALDQADIQSDFPVSEFLLTVGLFLILFVEQTVLVMK